LPNHLKQLLIWALITGVYFLSAHLGLSLAFEQANTSPVWPPTGIAIAALYYFGWRSWPGVFAGALLINYSTGVSVAVASGIALGNSLEALAAVYLIKRFTSNQPFSRVVHVARYVGIMLLATMISASIGVGSLSLGGAADWHAFQPLWLTWWLGDVVGGLVFGSLFLSWSMPYRGLTLANHKLEGLALVTTGLLAVLLVFSGWLLPDSAAYPLAFIFLPLVIWAAYRFCQHGATLVVVLVSLAALYGTLGGHGPFVQATHFESFLLLQGFMVLMSISGLILAASVAEMQYAHGQLQQTRLQLENRVAQRTGELQQANLQLEQEVSHRQQAAEALRSLLSATALYTDEAFFRNCIRDLAGVYGVRFAFIGLFTDASETAIRTLAVWNRDHFAENFQYQLAGTPCQDVLELSMELVTSGAQERYPDDELLVQLGIESYFGAPLISPSNRLMGLVAVMDDKPMTIESWRQPMLGIYANRMAQEYDRKITSDELRLAASVFNESVEAIMIADADAIILRINPAFSRITGYSAEESVGQNPRLLRSEHHGKEFYQEFWHALLQEGSWQGEIWNRRKNGDVFPAWQTITTVHDSEGRVARYISIFSDITDKKLSEERIFHLAHFDVVTGLPNRAAFQDQLERAIVHAERLDSQLSLLFLDLDHFKLINDTSGHPAGDELLRRVAARIQSLVREDDVVARLGGDEFTLLLADMDNDRDAAVVCEKILADLSRPFSLGQDEVVLTCSIGVSRFPQDGTDSATLLKNADAAMYQAKAQGRNNFQFYTAEINARTQQRLTMESAMRRALEQGEFLLHYQPQVNISSGHIIGVEALVRWQHPQQGLISPATFIPVAEDSGLIVPLGEWVMFEACRQHQQWIDERLPLMRMAVNLSARQFSNQQLVGTVARVIQQTGINPEYLELELTESIIMENVEDTVAILHELRDMGVYLSIDDFGTGYSSMAYLKRFPIDKLKIDQSFIRDLAQDLDDAAIVSATIAMAHSLNLTVIAEGVESKQQLRFLQSHGCEEMQGFYFSRPLPAEDISRLFGQEYDLESPGFAS